MDLLVIRHAEPIRLEVESGPADPPLHARGVAQAERLAAWLAREPIDAVVSSPLRRAVETAEPIAGATGHRVTIADGVAEYDRNFSWYVPIEELKASGDPRWHDMVGGRYFEEAAEAEDFAGRVIGAFEDIIDAHPGQRVAVICHGGVINVYLASVLGLPGNPMFFLPGYTSVSRVAASRGGVRGVVSLNELAHLRDA